MDLVRCSSLQARYILLTVLESNAYRALERVGSDRNRIESGYMAIGQPGEWIARYGNDTWSMKYFDLVNKCRR
jgi:hypothetical protein